MKLSRILSAAALILLMSCSDNATPPPPVPPPPVPAPPAAAIAFTSPPTASVAENVTGVIYTAQTDADASQSVTFSIAGPDADAFSIDTNSGELSLSTGANFELPSDENTDNVFDLDIMADAGSSSASLNLAITVTDDPGGPIALREVVTGLDQPLYLEELPDGSGRLLVLERAGIIQIVDPANGAVAAIPFLDVTATTSTEGERGLLGLAFSPDFATDNTFYLNITNLAGDTELRRYQTFASLPDQGDPLTEDIILQIAQPFNNHNGGWIGFDANGFLIFPTGDGGGAGDPMELAQNPNSLLGKVLRLDVNGDDFPGDDERDYAIPAGNTFANGIGGAPEIFALGLRNPFRSSIDPVTGDLFMGDVGQDEIEEIDRLDLSDASANFGWDEREGTQSFEGPDDPALTDPVTEYPHGAGPLEGNSVTGGYVYNGPLEALDRNYIFADFETANIWAVPERELIVGNTVPNTSFEILTNTLDAPPTSSALSLISSFGEDAEGNLYIISITGTIFVIEAG